jgi:hypothetical protein
VSIRPTPSLHCFSYSSLTCALRRNVKRTLENQQAGDVELLAEDLAEIAQLLETYPIKGGRYIDSIEQHMHLWN